jgi:hypothetical protein
MKITIKDKEVELKYTIRSLVLFENIKNESFNLQTTMDVIVYFLCVLLASDKTLQLTLDELIDLIDDDPKLLEDFSTWLTNEMNKQNVMSQDTHIEVKEGSKKK